MLQKTSVTARTTPGFGYGIVSEFFYACLFENYQSMVGITSFLKLFLKAKRLKNLAKVQLLLIAPVLFLKKENV